MVVETQPDLLTARDSLSEYGGVDESLDAIHQLISQLVSEYWKLLLVDGHGIGWNRFRKMLQFQKSLHDIMNHPLCEIEYASSLVTYLTDGSLA
jgi:hypothetical protein